MPTLIITVDPDCCRCSSKIQKVLCCLQGMYTQLLVVYIIGDWFIPIIYAESGEFAIDKVVYEKDKVIVSGGFDADKLSCKLCCKAGKIIKSIEEPPPPPPPPPPEQKCKPCPPWPCKCPPPYCDCECPPKPACKPKPEQCKPYPWPCACPPRYCHCPPPPDPKPDPKPEPKPEPCKVVLPYPFPYPYPPPAWGCGCPPPYCQCPKKPKPPSPPPPEPAPPARQCHCPTWPSCYHCWGYPPPMPYPPMVVCDDNPPYGACAIM
jgi:hypothetical protein